MLYYSTPIIGRFFFHKNCLLCVAVIIFCIKRIFAGPVPEKKPMNHRTRENGGSLCTLHSKSLVDPQGSFFYPYSHLYLP